MKITKEIDNCNRKNTNVYSYARWSSDAQSDGDSLRRQIQLAEGWCQHRGLPLAGFDKDEATSAWKGRNQREGSGLSRLLKQIKPGDYLLVEDNDRLSRQDWLTACNFLRDIVGKGVVVVTLANGNEIDKQRFERDPGCFLPVVLRSHLGHDENEKKSERIKASWEARRQRLRDGKAANLHLPCWLAWDDDVDMPVLVENNATVIRKMFALALGGLGCQTIARTLHKEGCNLVVEGKRRKRILTISAPYVWRTLRNKLTIGYGVYVLPPPPGVYPPVVEEQTFYAVQQRLEMNKHQTAPRSASTASLFTGIAHCSKCNGTLCRFTQCRGGKTYKYLVCSDTLHKHGRCGMASIRYDAVENTFLDLLANSDLIRRALAERQEEPSELDVLRGKLVTVQSQANKLFAAIEGDDCPVRRVMDRLRELEAEESQLVGQVQAAIAKVKHQKPAESAYGEIRSLADRIREPEMRLRLRAALPSLVEKIVVELGQNRYTAHFAGGRKIEVTLAAGKIGQLSLLYLHNSPDVTSFQSRITLV